MTQRLPELDAVLGDVRRAWRLVYAWQRRVNDLVAHVDAALVGRGYAFEEWRPTRYSPPPRTGTPFFRDSTWAWDMLPGYRFWVSWVRWDAEGGRTRRVTLDVCADTGFRKEGVEPDPADFLPAAQSDSVAWLGWWTATTHSPDWAAGWRELTRTPIVAGEQKSAVAAGVTYTVISRAVPLAALPDLPDVDDELVTPTLAWDAG